MNDCWFYYQKSLLQYEMVKEKVLATRCPDCLHCDVLLEDCYRHIEHCKEELKRLSPMDPYNPSDS